MRFANLTMTIRRIPGLVATGTALFALSACSLSTPSTTLTGFAAARDQAARTEAAASARATQLAELATECEPCSSALRTAASSSDTRLETLGGLWDPWGGTPPEGQEAPDPVSEAPTDVAAFVSWMARTATRDLQIATEEDAQSDKARTLAASALGRYANAVSIARAYEIDVNAGDSQASAVNDRVNTSSSKGVQSWDIESYNESSISSTFTLSGSDLASSKELSDAVAMWDCMASTLPKVHSDTDTLSETDTYDMSGALLVRADIALQAGAADTRTPRCELDSLDTATLASNLLAVDTALFASKSEAVRSAGARAALADIEQWASHTTLPALIGTR